MDSLRRIIKILVAPLILVVASGIFVGHHVAAHVQISPIDEYVYIDYFEKSASQLGVAHGEKTGDFARNYLACVGVAPAGPWAPEKCDLGDYSEDSRFPYMGINSADIYTPIYFVTSRIIAAPIQTLLGVDLVTAGRLTGAVWLAASAILIFASLRRLGQKWLFSTAVPFFLIASLPAWWSTTYISTDAVAMFFGALLGYLLIRYLQTRRHGWIIMLVSGLAVLAKFQNLMIVALVTLVLLGDFFYSKYLQRAQRAGRILETVPSAGNDNLTAFGSVVALPASRARNGNSVAVDEAPRHGAGTTNTAQVQPPRAGRRQLFIGFGIPLVALFSQALWMIIRPYPEGAEDPDQGTATPLGITQLIREAFKFFGSLTEGATGAEPFGASGIIVSLSLGWILIAAILGSTTLSGFPLLKQISLAFLVTTFIGGPALALATYIAEGYYFVLPSRYGLSLFPIMLVVMAAFFGRFRYWRAVLIALAALCFIVSFAFSFH
ncbi:hypothetical protein [Mycetocola spongiae]|uniref:hypothetical protein n=1 Tax=Mycetocola spongiae TaxID=2859226 RepID=UPI001CF13B21|nr:hypothetical protein [Mycetocola spongiae]UCR88948.1 hypothetical protein KXZ72_13530 [Mycetocola spongiae]